jgi:hypothetical protein
MGKIGRDSGNPDGADQRGARPQVRIEPWPVKLNCSCSRLKAKNACLPSTVREIFSVSYLHLGLLETKQRTLSSSKKRSSLITWL